MSSQEISPAAIRPILPADYEAAMALLRRSGGVQLRDADSFEATARYLARNPGLSFIAEIDGDVAGCVFGGHDGRRGYLYHLAVDAAHRGRGIGRALVNRALSALTRERIAKIHIDVLQENEEGMRFWRAMGWRERPDIAKMSIILSGGANS
jgi:ribosomal protein S18 acetylase RimI-like enzyme